MKFEEYLKEMVSSGTGVGTGTGNIAPYMRKLEIGSGGVVKRKYPDSDFNNRVEKVDTIGKWSSQNFGD